MTSFEDAVAAWRASREPGAAAAAEALAAEEPARSPLPASGKAKDVAAWNAVESEGNWRDFPRLIATLAAGKSQLATERVNALAKRDDPRMVPGLLAVLESPPFTGGSSKRFWQAVLAALVASGDPRARAGLDSLSKRYKTINDTDLGAWLAGAMSKAAGAMNVPAAAKPTAALDELLARVLEAPDDDDARLVYADLAIERGDERGELIVLQVERAAGRGSAERADVEREKFFRGTRPTRFGLALSAAANRIELERGFPAKIELANTGLEQVIDAPEWGTVHTLTRADVGQVATLLRFLDGGHLKSLVAIESLKARWIDKLVTPTFRWRRLTIINDGLKPQHLRRFPKLTHLELRRARELDASIFAAAPALESVTLVDPTPDDGAALFTGHPALRRLRLAGRSAPARFDGLAVRELALLGDVAEAGAWLRALPAVTSLELDLDDTDWQAAVAMFGRYPQLESLTLLRVWGDVRIARTAKGLTLTALPTERWEKLYEELINAAPALRDGGVGALILYPEGPRHRVPPLREEVIAMMRAAWPDLELRDLL